MSNSRQRWYLDACVITRLLENRHDTLSIQELVVRAEAGEAIIIVNTIMLVEVSRERNKPIDPVKYAKILEFFDHSYIYVHDFDRTLAGESADLILDYLWLHPQDAAHLATAINANCDVFFTYDDELLHRFDDERGLQVIEPGQPIRQDDALETTDLPLFKQDESGPIA